MNLRAWIRRQFRRKTRVYILPTKMGGYLSGLIFIMFLLAIGYSNNLLLIFTLFLLGFNLVWLVQTHFHLHRLKLDQVIVAPGHAKDPLSVKVSWKRTPSPPWNWELWLERGEESYSLSACRHQNSSSMAELRLPKRGLYRWHYLGVRTTNPFGLYQVWIYYPIEAATVVFPSLLSAAMNSLQCLGLEGEIASDRRGLEDFMGLSPYQHEESRKISWKHYARTGELLVREGEDRKAAIVEIELALPEKQEDRENYVSRVATQLVDCYRRDIPFTIRDKSFHPPASTHVSHLNDCLKVLALC